MSATPARAEKPKAPKPSAPAKPPQAPAGGAPTLAFRLATRTGRADDPLEREADRVAERVVRADAPAVAPIPVGRAGGAVQRCACGGGGCARCQEEERLASVQRREDGDASPAAVAPDPDSVLHPSGGSPLDAGTRSWFEPRLGRDLAAVRIHTGPRADESARSVRALAYTVGPSVVFREGYFRPGSAEGRTLLAHELAHVAQQGHAPPAAGAGPAAPVGSAPARALQRLADPTAETLDPKFVAAMADADLETNIRKAEKWLATHGMPDVLWAAVDDNLKLMTKERAERRKKLAASAADRGAQESWQAGESTSLIGLVQEDLGIVMYNAPDKSRISVRDLSLNTRVVVDRTLPNGWLFVILENGDYGYVDATGVNTSLPDPEAKLYRIEPGMSAQKIVKQFYKDFTWGQDERFYVNVLAFVNHEAKRNGIRKPSLDADWDTTTTEAGRQIWIPGEGYVKSLKGKVSSGSFTYEAWQTVKGAVSAVGEFLVGSIAFVAGILHGALESLWDILVGLKDLVVMIWDILKSLFQGELISDAKKLWDDLSNLKLSEVFDAVSDSLDKKWNADSTWDRWHFRGWLIGYIAMEIITTFFTGGLATAVKWVGKSAKVAKLLEKLPALARLAKRAEAFKDAKAVAKLREAMHAKAVKGLSVAHQWVAKRLRIPADILIWISEEAAERLKKLSSWAVEVFGDLSHSAMKKCLGCASPCKVDLAEIEKFLLAIAPKAAANAKKLLTIDDVLAAIKVPAEGLTLLRAKLQKHPGLLKVIQKAELTDLDMAKILDFLSDVERKNPATVYRTFTRYLTNVVPVKVRGDLKLFNEIVEAMVEVSPRQGAALKGPMFEQFAKLNIPRLGGKQFSRVAFDAKKYKLAATRTADAFVEATGELWDMKHSMSKVPADQAADYAKILAASAETKVTSINYVFPTEAAAKASEYLKSTYKFNVYFIEAGTNALKIL